MNKLAIATLLLVCHGPRLAAQAVGSLPERSPFADIRESQRIGIEAGWLSTARDKAAVGPKSGPLVGLRYDFHAGGPAYITSHVFGVSTTRDVLDYTRKKEQRKTGTQSSTLVGGDVGLSLALTGARSFHKWQPLINANVGVVSGVGDKPDVSKYSFGTGFYLGLGFGARYVTGQNSEFRGDIGWRYWKLKYPETFRSTDGDPIAIVPSGSLSPWTANRAITLSWTWGIFR